MHGSHLATPENPVYERCRSVAGQTKVTLKQMAVAVSAKACLLGSERHYGLPIVCCSLSGTSALLYGQAAVGFLFERADEFLGS